MVEIQGTPAVSIASSEFVTAATAQADALGMPDAHRVFVQHPIQDATDAEMHEKAEPSLRRDTRTDRIVLYPR